MQPNFEVIYNSGMIIGNRDELATLSIFYDKVLLPWDNPWNPYGFIKLIKDKVDKHWIVDTPEGSSHFLEFEQNGETTNNFDYLLVWYESNKELFDTKVIDWVVNSPLQKPIPQGFEVTNLFTQLYGLPHTFYSSENEVFVNKALILHLLRTDLQQPGIMSLKKTNNRETFKFYQAKNVFKYLLPKINEMHPQEILRLRELVKDTREGFSLHLQKLSNKVESSLKENYSISDLNYEAQRVIETELIPDYREFVRQLSAVRLSKGGLVLDSLGKFLSIDAAPWTPKFWGQVIAAFGPIFKTQDQAKIEESNSQQAFKFMHVCEE